MQLKYIYLQLLGLIMLGSFYSCSKSSGGGYGSNTTPPVTPPATTPTVSFQIKNDSHFGSVITDGSGNTLYFFSLDANGNSACTSGCLPVWPVVYSASPTFGTGLNAGDFSTITRTDGSKQTTYKGWPLYTYSGDGMMLSVTQLVGDDGVKYDSTYKAGTGPTLYITDDRGVTLYSFTVDKSGKNNYTLSDFSNDSFWPIVQLSSVQNVPSSLDKSAFSSITVFGQTQLTYKGWPVYRFGPDALTRGNTKGVSITTPGAWPVMNQFSKGAPL
jgi:predicted lipoprotein with Yx(FWY)xxD motif